MESVIKVAIFDDHPVVREGLKALVDNEAGMKVVGDSGIVDDLEQVVRGADPDILLLDVHMGGPTFDLIAKAQALKADLKIVFITGFDTEHNLQQAVRLGAHGLVSKMEDGKIVCDALRAAYRGETYFSEAARNRRSRNKSVPSNHPLSPREVDVLCCVARAMSAKEIAQDLNISVKTVDRHKANIMDKLNLRSQIELARYAIKHGFVDI